jgi:uncharacterized membrane protein YkoI
MRSRNASMSVLCLAATMAAGRQGTASRQQGHRDSAAAGRTISADSARAIVRAHLPKVRVTSQHLRRANGRLLYVFRLRSADNGALVRVTVDALTGAYAQALPLAAR